MDRKATADAVELVVNANSLLVPARARLEHCGSAQQSPSQARVLGKASCEPGPHGLVSMHGNGENFLLTSFRIDVVTPSNALQSPAGPFQLKAKLRPSDGLHTANSTT